MCKYLQAISKCVQLCACVQICSKYVQIYVKCVQNKCANPFKNHHSPGPGSLFWAAGTRSLCLTHRRWAPQVAPFSLGGLAGHIVQAWSGIVRWYKRPASLVSETALIFTV